MGKGMKGNKSGMFHNGQSKLFTNKNKNIGGSVQGDKLPSVTTKREVKKGSK